MKRVLLLGVCAIPLFFIACSSDKEDSAEQAQERNVENFGTRDDEKDADFIVAAVESSYAEIKFAQLALNKSKDENLKDIATQIEDDNSKILNELKDLSYKKGIAIPVEESENTKVDIQNFHKEPSDEFNRNWAKTMMDQQKKSLNYYESIQEKTGDSELKSWINETIPDIRYHLDSLTAYLEKLQ